WTPARRALQRTPSPRCSGIDTARVAGGHPEARHPRAHHPHRPGADAAAEKRPALASARPRARPDGGAGPAAGPSRRIAMAAATVRAAVAEAARVAPGLPLVAGGKSFGGRMTSTAQAEAPLPGVRGLLFLGFPLHPPGRPDDKRAEHLAQVRVPMLFLQGDRDEFADLTLLRPVVQRLGERATLHLV